MNFKLNTTSLFIAIILGGIVSYLSNSFGLGVAVCVAGYLGGSPESARLKNRKKFN